MLSPHFFIVAKKKSFILLQAGRHPKSKYFSLLPRTEPLIYENSTIPHSCHCRYAYFKFLEGYVWRLWTLGTDMIVHINSGKEIMAFDDCCAAL